MLAACAGSGPVYEGQFAYDDGWSIGRVTEVGPPLSITERSSKDCRRTQIAEGHGNRTFARVAYQRGRQYRSIISMVQADLRLAPGDSVYVNFLDCDLEVAPRHAARTR